MNNMLKNIGQTTKKLKKPITYGDDNVVISAKIAQNHESSVHLYRKELTKLENIEMKVENNVYYLDSDVKTLEIPQRKLHKTSRSNTTHSIINSFQVNAVIDLSEEDSDSSTCDQKQSYFAQPPTPLNNPQIPSNVIEKLPTNAVNLKPPNESKKDMIETKPIISNNQPNSN